MDIVNKLWRFCHKLRHDGVDPSDYVEQLTYLLFLKISDERGVIIPKGFGWQNLMKSDSQKVLQHLESTLNKLKNEPGILGDIFSEPVSRVKNAEILQGLIKEIDSINWSSYDADVVGLAFEELLDRVASEGKKGAGQYFTPRPLIKAIVEVMKPDPFSKKSFKIGDVAVGTAGFLVVALEWFKRTNTKKLTEKQTLKLAKETYFGQELVQRPRRLALMNMFLHGIEASILHGDTIYGNNKDENTYDCILTNPPFGTKGANQIPSRNFPIRTTDKQLNFIQHIIEKLKPGGRAAIVLPDSCLSNDIAKKIWAHYLVAHSGIQASDVCCLHTILKLPDGVFASYANGIKACVIFLEKGKPTTNLWIYDQRRDNIKITTKSNALSEKHFLDFIQSYGSDPNGTDVRSPTKRFRQYTIDQIIQNNFDLSFIEAIKPAETLPAKDLIEEIIRDYEDKIAALKKLKTSLS